MTRLLTAAAAACLLATAAGAQELPIRWYGTQDGLASANITALLQDSRGYLWIATLDGVSRFDGTAFVSYRAPDDLIEPVVWTVAEDPSGGIWLGTNGKGVARLTTRGSSDGATQQFHAFPLAPGTSGNAVDAIAFDGRGRMWCVSDGGLYRTDPRHAPLAFERVVPATRVVDHDDAFVQSADHLWFATGGRLVEVRDDRIVAHPLPDQYARQTVQFVRGRPDGTIVVALETDVLELTQSSGQDVWQAHGLALTDDVIQSLAVAPDGSLWIGTAQGLIDEGAQRRRFGAANGIDAAVTAVYQDRGGRVWIGTRLGGVGRLSTPAVVTFSTAQGMPKPVISRVVEGADGGIVASTWGGAVSIQGDRVERLPLGETAPFSSMGRRLITDRFGHWWIGTSAGLFFIRGPAFDLRRAVHIGSSYGVPDAFVFDGPGLRVVDDTIYAVFGETVYGAPVDDTGPSRFHAIEAMPKRAPLDVMSDSTGRLWMATFGGLAWKAPRQPAAEASLALDARTFMRDSGGALWLGTRNHGLAVTSDPTSARPRYRMLTRRDGLSSDTVWSIAERGRGIYVGTGRGVDRIDRQTGAIENLSAAAGLAPADVYQVMVDSHDRLWAATANGLVRFDAPIEVRRLDPSVVYVTNLRLNGHDVGVPPLGARRVAAPGVVASRSDLTVDYAAIDVDRIEAPTYEYRLDGIDSGWSRPTTQRAVSYARLPPGRYGFEVRSVTPDGLGPVATVMLDVQPALWQRWWFLALALTGVVGAALAVQRVRLGRIIALERVRRQIASDLHDDLGSGLAQIAVLAEVAQRHRDGAREGIMADVADIARGLRSSVADIVWAVDPRHDHLADAISRMRELAVSMLEPLGIAVTFATDLHDEAYLAPDRRRHLLLFFKEAVTNVARHSGARHVHLDVRTRSGRLVLAIADDGCGFDAATVRRGQGLDNLAARARALGGSVRIESAPGGGTRTEIECPV